MKEKYSTPAVVNSGTLEGNGLVPLVVGGITVKAAAALLAGFMAGRAATKAMEARPGFKLPSLTKGRIFDDDFCMA